MIDEAHLPRPLIQMADSTRLSTVRTDSLLPSQLLSGRIQERIPGARAEHHQYREQRSLEGALVHGNCPGGNLQDCHIHSELEGAAQVSQKGAAAGCSGAFPWAAQDRYR